MEDIFMEDEVDEDHDENCVFCDAVVTLFQILTGLLDQLQAKNAQLPAVKYNQLLYLLRKCEYDIDFFKGWKVRSYVTRKARSTREEESTCSDAYLVYDFPMKYFLQQHRGTTTGWFGKVSL